MTKHFLTGKARSLEDALQVMRETVSRYGFVLSEHKWLNPAPHIWSVHVKAENCPMLFANGKGISREAALASAYGEFLERLMTGYFYGDYALSCETLDYVFVPDERVLPAKQAWKKLPEALKAIWDEDGELIPEADLPSLACCKTETLRCVPLKPWTHAEADVAVPWNVLMNLYGSNGLSAGNTPLEAQIQGLSEIFERWVRREIILHNYCLPEVPEAVLAADERVLEARAALAEHGIALSVRDASLGSGYPVVAIILYQQGQGRAFVSFGAHPVFEVALERTLTEAFQGRALAQLDGFQPPSDDLDWIQSAENLEQHFIDASGQFHWRFFSQAADFEYGAWGLPATATLEAQWQYLLNLLARHQQPLYGQVYSAGDFFACRMIAPGMSEVFPLDELVSNNQNQGCHLRRHLLAYAAEKDWAEGLIELLDAFGWAEHASVPSLIGLPVAEASVWRGMKLIDLRMAAYCMLQDWVEVEAWLESALHFSQDVPWRHGAYQTLARLLETEDLTPYLPSLKALYGEKSLQQARQWWAGNGFYGVPVGKALLEDDLLKQLWRTHPGRTSVEA